MIKKLVKTESTYHLVVNNKIIASVGDSDGKLQKLSLKNCEIVRSGYDLDELAENYGIEKGLDLGCFDEVKNSKTDFKAGFQKALELLGNKKFTEEQVRILIYNERNVGLKPKDLIDVFLKNEWDVEIEIEVVDNAGFPIYRKPRLDADGCLILKRK